MAIFPAGPVARRAPANPVGLPGTGALELGPWVAFPPWLFPPRGAPIMQDAQSLTLAPGVTGVILTFDVNVGNMLRIAQVGFGANDPTALSNATFSIKANGNIVQGWGLTQLAIGTIAQPADVYVFVPGSGLATLEITNNFPGSTWTYQARWVGWTFDMTGAYPATRGAV